MITLNQHYFNLAGNYLFAEIAKRVNAYKEANPTADVIRLGIGDVTQPLCPAVIEALHKAVDEMAHAETFRGYAPEQGYDFLREAMWKHDYERRGCPISADEIFISDGAKSDSGNIQEIFAKDNLVAVCDPVYPVYVDSNVMAGRCGIWNKEKEQYNGLMYLPCEAENGFAPALPEGQVPDMIYLCSPNNPTGTALSKQELQKWVDYAREHGSVLIFDAAYEAYITDPEIPHSVYECEGAEECAIELRSFSKNAGFTGTRLGATVVPHALKGKVCMADGSTEIAPVYPLWMRRQTTKFNGTAYIVQRAGEAVYSPLGQQQTKEQVAYYMDNAAYIRSHLEAAGYTVYGGTDAPYIWMKTENGMTSWEFFDYLLDKAHVVGTPGAGFGAKGEGYFRLTAFGDHENTREAVRRIVALRG